ncbi:putative cytochrome P450 alkane hydroxylase [Aspergillus affinis]|uniref:putative cytochrome P450 alkane hydroxylase n=1 Tax=Aspergillus affinis TaxID=1070780 RepID=UPI0022FE3A62|nr:putative cytochrome P450 alkane hydroxylase [Aspergillus affinis]KAI9044289.1 putative cytochrome P450 alkane hydroxylase [Aspergillus affinis]
MLAPLVVFGGALYLTFLVLQYIQQLYKQRKHAQSLRCQPAPPGTPGIFGFRSFYRLSRAAKEKRWVEYIANQYGIYGNTFTQKVMGRWMISTIDPENIKAILATQFTDFSLGTRHREFYPLLGDGIFTLDAGGWSHARGLLRPQFARDQVADLNLMDGHISRMIDLIPTDGSSFDIQRLFFMLTIDSATHFLFGESVGSMHSSADAGLLEKSSVGNAQGFAEAFNTSQDYLTARSRAVGFYWMVNPKEFQDSVKRVHEVVDHYVRLAIESKNHPEKKEQGRYIFAEALAEDNDDPKVLRDNMLNILLAGRDTTASLLSSAFFFMSRNPAVWKKLRGLIVEEFGDSEHPREQITQTKLKDIPYLRYVLNEVLRLMPPVPLNFRVATRDTSLPVGGGPDRKSPIYVTKGMVVTYSVYAMHRRTDFYGPDAHVFRPERWQENGRRSWDYLPFNGGPRICLGQQYALTEASYTLVKLAQKFETVECADPEIQVPKIHSTLTMSHDRGVPSTAAPPQGSDPSKSKIVKPDPVNNNNPSTSTLSTIGTMSNPVNVAPSAVRPQQPQPGTKGNIAPVVVDNGASSAEISESEMQLVSSLAKLQKLEAMVHQLRTLLPDRLLDPLRPNPNPKAAAQSVPRSPGVLFQQLSQSFQDGTAEVQAFQNMWRGPEMKAVWEHVDAQIKENGGILLQPTGVWEQDYDTILEELLKEQEKQNEQQRKAGEEQERSNIRSAEGGWRAVVDGFAQRNVPGMRLIPSKSQDSVIVALAKAGMVFDVHTVGGTEGNGVPEWQVTSKAAPGQSQTKMEKSITDCLNARPQQWDLAHLLDMISSYSSIKQTPCMKCGKMTDAATQLPTIRQHKLMPSPTAGQPPSSTWEAYHASCL